MATSTTTTPTPIDRMGAADRIIETLTGQRAVLLRMLSENEQAITSARAVSRAVAAEAGHDIM